MPWTFPTESFSLGGGKAGVFLIGSIGDSHFYQAFFLPRDHLAAKAWERRLECTQREEFQCRSSAQSLSPPFSSSTFILLHVCLICAVSRMSYAYIVNNLSFHFKTISSVTVVLSSQAARTLQLRTQRRERTHESCWEKNDFSEIQFRLILAVAVLLRLSILSRIPWFAPCTYKHLRG